MTFDINKATEVEGMTEADFGVWKSARYNEVINSIEDKLRIVSNHFNCRLALIATEGRPFPEEPC